MKFGGEITNYRVIPFEGVLVRTRESGREKPRTVYTLYTRYPLDHFHSG